MVAWEGSAGLATQCFEEARGRRLDSTGSAGIPRERETEGARTHGLGEAARLDSTRHKTSVGARSKRAMADAAGGQLKAVAAGAGEE